MNEIFISYRHSDTGPWAAALMRDLVRSFGDKSVFMDLRDESLPWGSRWSPEIEQAAMNCEAMLVLMGPQWIDCRADDGQRRLLCERDWIRREVSLGLQGHALVLPLLFKGGRKPVATDLPLDLSQLLSLQFNRTPISDYEWDVAFGRLVNKLVARPILKKLHDLCTTRSGIAYLRDLINTRPDVLRAVAVSRSEVRRAAEQIGTLKSLKDVHDALHSIEFHCLETMRNAPPGSDLGLYELDLAEPVSQIHAAAAGLKQTFPALAVLDVRLEAIVQLMRGGESNVDASMLVAELEALISSAPDAVDTLIKSAATSLSIGGLADLLGTLRGVLPDQAGQDVELAPLVGLTKAIDGIRQHVDQLVREHGQLQALDFALRFVRRGNPESDSPDGASLPSSPGVLRLEWPLVEIEYKALVPPYSDELARSGFHVLASIEEHLRLAIQSNDLAAAWAGFDKFFVAVGKVFWNFDSRLKVFCTELDTVTKPLHIILTQLEESHG